jgi:hypothetical protein
MNVREYKLTEEVARQAVEVIFAGVPGWYVCFSNPTAGPWKLIRLMTPEGPKEVDRFLKEDVRPDVVLQHFDQDIFILLEAKDQVQKLLNDTQMEKSIGMFQSEIRRLQGLVTRFEGKSAEQRYTHLTGFLYPSSDPARDLRIFHEAYERLLRNDRARQLEIDHYITFLVQRKESRDLFISWHIAPLKGDARQVIKKLLKVFPEPLTQYRPDA